MKGRKLSAAAVVWRRGPSLTPGKTGPLEVLIVHPGGPFFRGKVLGAWSFPKGEHEEADMREASLVDTALRELLEETGLMVETPAVPLGEVRQKGGKRVVAFAFEADGPLPEAHLPPQIRIEWPPGSGRETAFPEVDEALFAPLERARELLNPAQAELLARLVESLG
jgi:predicted NUDIX family NTP pyrophosphohydrolase